MAVNIFYDIFRVSIIIQAASRAGNLSLINIIFFYFNYYLSFVSNILGLFLSIYRRVYVLTGAIIIFLGLLYAIINIANIINPNLFSASGQLFGFIIKVINYSLENRVTD